MCLTAWWKEAKRTDVQMRLANLDRVFRNGLNVTTVWTRGTTRVQRSQGSQFRFIVMYAQGVSRTHNEKLNNVIGMYFIEPCLCP